MHKTIKHNSNKYNKRYRYELTRWVVATIITFTGWSCFASEAEINDDATESATNEYLSARITLGPLAMGDDIIEGMPSSAARCEALFENMHAHRT